jgi:hypothetical protein
MTRISNSIRSSLPSSCRWNHRCSAAPPSGRKIGFPRERFGPGEWMRVDEQRIVDAVEFDRLADGRGDDAGLPTMVVR